MKRMDDVERTIRDLCAKPDAEADRRILADATAALVQATEMTPHRAIRPRSIDMIRKHMKGFIAAAAAATIVLAGMFWWMTSGTKPPMSAYAALAVAVKNSQAAEWVHYRMEVGGQVIEAWAAFQPVRLAAKLPNQLTYRDYGERRQYVYDPAERTITVDSIDDADPNLDKFPNLFAAIMAKIDELTKKGVQVARTQETMDGMAYDVYTVDKNDTSVSRIMVDPVVQRVVAVEERDRSGKLVPGTAVHLDYPQGGPADIYALGAPKDAKVVQGSFGRMKALVDKVEAARAAFAPSYYAIIYEPTVRRSQRTVPDSTCNVTVVYRKGPLYRIEQYGDTTAKVRSEIAAEDMPSLESWTRSQQLASVFFCDARLEADPDTRRPGATWVMIDSHGALTEKPFMHMWRIFTVEGAVWLMPLPAASGVPGMAMLPDEDGPNGKLEGIEWLTEALPDVKLPTQKCGWYFNTARDCVAEMSSIIQYGQPAARKPGDAFTGVATDKLNGQYQRTELRKVVEYAETPTGQWYVRKATTHVMDRSAGESDKTTWVFLDTTREIPDDLFDLAKFEAEHKAVEK